MERLNLRLYLALYLALPFHFEDPFKLLLVFTSSVSSHPSRLSSSLSPNIHFASLPFPKIHFRHQNEPAAAIFSEISA
ncbi:hypothetical protein M5K25_019025 [Dendrobium thyrsiflorum]|uniref:Uncharacterized protein n=1 Tax=Dendrobium thyrsiflorum TaxID=117978 RepID=A0ABD0UE30_DENTH